MLKPIKRGLVYTNTNCTGCNKCIKACGVMGACIATDVLANENSFIKVDGDRCIACGACFDACEHNAREFDDDTLRFFEDLDRGEAISVLIAPAFKANYPDRYEEILGALHTAGVQHMISVSFGADIATWGILKYIKEHDFYGAVSQACPVVVDFIEKYEPELIPMLMPVQSPLMCAAIYARTQLHIQDKFAFISPCIAKKIEIDDPDNNGFVSYNVTFDHLLSYLKEHNITGQPCSDELPYDLGTIWPMPGGLAEYARLLAGDDAFIRQIGGEQKLIEYLRSHAEIIKNRETPALFIDALNCERGCLCGTATEMRYAGSDSSLYNLVKIKREVSKKSKLTDMTPRERMEELERRFGSLDLNDYIRSYHDKSQALELPEPTEEELSDIFREMNKTTAESRSIDCTACGYGSCKEMACAIYYGFNRKENCIHYLRDSVVMQEEKIRYIAEHDELLDVFNRRTLLGMMLKAQKEHGYGMVLVDINGFGGINETYGHDEADRVLRQFSENLREHTRKYSGITARSGSDEFIVLYPGKSISKESPETQAVTEAVCIPVEIGGNPLRLTACIGVINSEPDSVPALDIEHARMMVALGKSPDTTVILLYNDEMRARFADERIIKTAIQEALENDGFYMLYQPQVDLKTGEVCGFESLVRMKAPGMYPGRFIPVAEASSMIWKIGRVTTELVIRQIGEWLRAREDVKPVAINFSSMQISDDGYLDFLGEMLEKYNVPAKLVKIEITESLFVGETAHAARLFDRLKSMGLMLLMDDFGSGYSSLGYLSYIPADIIKLDKTLVDAYLVEGKDSFIDKVIGMIHDLDKKIIVEGVENPEQIVRLQKFGADIVQGYVFSKPLMPEDAIRFRV